MVPRFLRQEGGSAANPAPHSLRQPAWHRLPSDLQCVALPPDERGVGPCTNSPRPCPRCQSRVRLSVVCIVVLYGFRYQCTMNGSAVPHQWIKSTPEGGLGQRGHMRSGSEVALRFADCPAFGRCGPFCPPTSPSPVPGRGPPASDRPPRQQHPISAAAPVGPALQAPAPRFGGSAQSCGGAEVAPRTPHRPHRPLRKTPERPLQQWTSPVRLPRQLPPCFWRPPPPRGGANSRTPCMCLSRNRPFAPQSIGICGQRSTFCASCVTW